METNTRWVTVAGNDEGEGARGRSPGASGLTILLAEDDEAMRRFLYDELSADGNVVVTACDGIEVLETLGGVSKLPFLPPDVMVMDVRMPGYSGLHVLAALRSAQWSTPVILITAFGDERVHEEGTRLGAVAVFDKPLDIDDLRTALRNLDHRVDKSAHPARTSGE